MSGMSPLSRFAVRFVRTYQDRVSGRLHASCGQSPSCSEYALALFERYGFLRASAKTIVRIARCRPRERFERRRRLARRVAVVSALLACLGLMGALFAGPAGAEVTAGCSGTANERTFADISRAFPLRVRESQLVTLNGQAAGPIRPRLYVVRLYYFGIRYGIRGGTTDQNQWSGTFGAREFLTRGTGNYIVEGILTNRRQQPFCIARLYIRVNPNPFGTTLGQAAAGATVAGMTGLILSAATGSKVPPGFEEISTPEDERKIEEKQEEEKKDPYEDEIKEAEWKRETEKMCWLLVLPALLLTTGAMASGGGGSGAISRPARRVRWRPRLSVVGIGSGILFSVGGGILLQQSGAIWPTLGMGIGFLVGGLALGVLLPSLGRARAVAKMNRILARNRPQIPGPWAPTHRASDEGLSVWEQPDPSTGPGEDIEAGVEVQLVQRRGDWAQVTAEDGRSGWVDAQQLEELEVQMSVAPTAAPEPSPEETREANEEPNDIPPDWYPDPSGEARLRYWDGVEWTDHTAE